MEDWDSLISEDDPERGEYAPWTFGLPGAVRGEPKPETVDSKKRQGGGGGLGDSNQEEYLQEIQTLTYLSWAWV